MKIKTMIALGLVCAGISVVCTGTASAAEADSPRDDRPSIIFILADDLGYGDLGCYGQKKIKTPNIDRLAAEGMRFTQAYAGCTVCAPSRATLMCGRHTGHSTIRGNSRTPLKPEDLTVAQYLKGAGYKTGIFGKWGLGLEGSGAEPGNKGFDQWLGFLDQHHAHDYYTDYLWRYDPAGKMDGKISIGANQDGKKGLYVHDWFTKAATNFVRIYHPQYDNKYAPFFLYLAYTIPHANNELTKATGNGNEVPGDAPYSNENWPQPEKNKAAMITRLDSDVGKLLDVIQHHKQEERTIIFFTSDNGPHKEGGNDPKFFQSSGPLRGIKRDLYEGGIRMPMIVKWPGRIKAGVVSDQPWAFWDFLPTALELAKVRVPKDIDGISIAPTLLGERQAEQHEFFYWEFHEQGSKQAVRMGDWKAVRLSPDGPLELYNLKTDLGEKENVADQNPRIVARIADYLKTARTENAEWPLKAAAK